MYFMNSDVFKHTGMYLMNSDDFKYTGKYLWTLITLNILECT
jgi:hypothetical protein